MKLSYERIVQWTAGPIAIIAGWLATKLVTHTSFLGQAGLGHDQIAHAITVTGTFVVGAGVTYAAHHKWLDNVNKVLTTFGTRADPPIQKQVEKS